ncbi:MAG: RDD family protein [Chitinophagia bacterium]|nr:RDD family protein [Chitinophagia bacterium]
MDNNQFNIFPDRPVRYAGFWLRFGASFLDGLIIGIPASIVNLGLTAALHKPAGDIVGFMFSTIIGWIYFATMESGAGQATVGKRALKIKVTDLKGGRLTFGAATARHFSKWLSVLILFIGYLMMLWNDKHQTLHDRIAGAVVISEE